MRELKRSFAEEVALRVAVWETQLGVGKEDARALRDGVFDLPRYTLAAGKVLPAIPQAARDLEFAAADLAAGCQPQSRIYEEVSWEYARQMVKDKNVIISSAFVHWSGEGDDESGRFIVNLHEASKLWDPKSMRMDRPVDFALEVQRGERLLSFDIKAGYRHFRLHDAMRPYVLFHYDGRVYASVALPFGWSMSPYWFTRLLKPMVGWLRQNGFRVLAYLDDFLVGLRTALPATASECLVASEVIQALLDSLGITRHPTKGCWGEGSQCLEHLGITFNTLALTFYATPAKVRKVQRLSSALLHSARKSRRLVSRSFLTSFCGFTASLNLVMPLSRFYTRSLHDDLARHSTCSASRNDSRVRLSNRSLRDLKHWARVSRGGRLFVPQSPQAAVHTDASKSGYGGTLGFSLVPGTDGVVRGHGVWDALDRRESINLLELRALRMLPAPRFAAWLKINRIWNLHGFCDNLSVVHIVNAMVSASPAMMKELRLLKRELDTLGVAISLTWLPSALNHLADLLSR